MSMACSIAKSCSYRVGICGLGDVSQYYLHNLVASKEFELVAACDPDPETWQKVRVPVGYDVNHLLSYQLDLLIIAAPTHLHYKISKCVQESAPNVAILLEKPGALTLSGLEEIYAGCPCCHLAAHVAFADEIQWMATNCDKLGALKSFKVAFDDPLVSDAGILAPRAANIGGCWLDSGINVILGLMTSLKQTVEVLDVQKRIGYGLKIEGQESSSCTCCISATARVKVGSSVGAVEIDWTRGRNSKTFHFTFEDAEVVLDTTARQVVMNGQVTADFNSELSRLHTRYKALLEDAREVLRGKPDNREFSLKAHASLYMVAAATEEISEDVDMESDFPDSNSSSKGDLSTGFQSSEAPDPEPSPECRRRRIQILSYMDVFATHFTYASIIPEAYGLALHLGRDAVFSGWLISAQWGAVAVGTLLIARPFVVNMTMSSQRAVALIAMLVISFSNLVFGLVVGFAGTFQASNDSTAEMALAARLFIGFAWSVMTMVVSLACTKVTLKHQQVQTEVWRQFFILAGLGAGPLVSACLCDALNFETVPERAGAIGFFSGFLWLAIFVYASSVLPTDEDLTALLRAKDEDEKAEKHLPVHAKEATEGTQLIPSTHAENWQMAACAAGACYGLSRAFLTSATESGTSFILQAEFLWSTAQIGVLVGTTFIVAAFAILAQIVAHQTWGMADAFMNINAFVAFCGTLLLSPRVSHSPYLIVLADFLIFAAAFCAGSIAEGRAMQHARPGTILSMENIWVIRNVGKNNISRFLAPPTARMALSSSGRGFYQMVLQSNTAFGCALLFFLTYAHTKANHSCLFARRV